MGSRARRAAGSLRSSNILGTAIPPKHTQSFGVRHTSPCAAEGAELDILTVHPTLNMPKLRDRRHFFPALHQ